MIPLSPRAYFECLAGVVIVGLTIGSWIVTLQRDKARAELAEMQVQAARSQDALKLAKLRDEMGYPATTSVDGMPPQCVPCPRAIAKAGAEISSDHRSVN